jgi:hypothetical protein
MPSPSTAELVGPVTFPDDLGAPVFQERRTFPVAAVFGVPAAFLVVAALAVDGAVAHVVLGLAAIAAVAVVVERRRHALIETYVVTASHIAILQPGGGRVAIPVAGLTSVHSQARRVRLEGADGVMTLGYVRRRRALLRTLTQVAPQLRYEPDVDTMCLTCAVRY